MSAPQHLKIGVLLCGAGVQLLDVAAVDLLGMLSTTYLRVSGFPENIVSLGHEVQVHYIVDAVKSEGEAPPKVSVTTSDLGVRITDTLDSVGDLDILVIPGPPPSYVPSADTISFLQKYASSPHTKAILVICSGTIPAAFSGILAGKRATAPLSLLPMLREKFPDVEWVAKRWTTDFDDGKDEKEKRKIWTSGAITNGTDMIAEYVKETFDPKLAKFVCALADVGDRAQEYPEWQLNTELY